jgi:colicin import membrane protein
LSYFFPVLLAAILHFSILAVLFISPFKELQQSRELPRHIQAQMYDLKTLTTALQKDKAKAKDKVLDKTKKEPINEPKKEIEKKPEKPPEEKKEEPRDENKERELQKQAKAKQREVQKQALEKELLEKKKTAKKQREIELKRKLAAKEKADKAAKLKDKQRKEKDAKRKKEALDAKKKAATEKKRKQQALDKKKKQDKKRKEEERVRIKALQKQIADEEQFAADQIAHEMATGIDVYIKRILSSNLRIPSTARNGIKAMVRIKLLPSGKIVGVELIESSGNSAFDKAAEQAVWRSESFPRVAEIASASPRYFNRELRTFIITFKPEELRW